MALASFVTKAQRVCDLIEEQLSSGRHFAYEDLFVSGEPHVLIARAPR
jgi:hypothetical protein